MADEQQLSDVTIIVNNVRIGKVPNSAKFTNGDGEQKVHVVSDGGGDVRQVFAEDLETNVAMVSWEMRMSPQTEKQVREWKRKKNTNVVQFLAGTGDGGSDDMIKTFRLAALVGDTEFAIGSDTTVTVDFKTAQAI